MTHIHIDVEGMRLEIMGHAGYAEIGQDIVCAGISTLAYTLAQSLAMMLHPDDYSAQFDDTAASCYIAAQPPMEKEEECRHAFMTIANGFAMMAAQYDQYIHLEGD